MSNHRYSNPADSLPLDKVASALREITESLALEFAAPSREPPQWSDFEWRIAQAVAAMQGISSLLSTRLQWTGPANWHRFLDEQRKHIAGRSLKIEQLLDRIDSLARRDEIALVGLKGAALLKRGIYRIGERAMADIDLLVRNADVTAATRLLQECGFGVTFTTWRHQLFEMPQTPSSHTVGLGEHVDNPIKIEVHTSIRERLPVSETDITQFVFPIAACAGVNAYPSSASLMMHLLLHAAGNIRAHALRLIQLHDIARLAGTFAASDWEELLSARPSGRGLWWAVPPLALVERYFPATIPQSVIERVSMECPWLLRKVVRHQRLADVSWSNLRVYAFPGIEWSMTLYEAIRFAITRIWPSREARAELTRFAAHHPGASGVPWYGISQGARMLRWVFSKPPRVQALLPVRAALAQRYDPSGSSVTPE
jgi:hypothetical protein